MFGASTATPYADFNQALTPVTSYSQGSDAGSYTVRAGETLESIAANLWGDSSLWYLLASANGLSGPGSPGAGRTLAIPANVMSNAHNASTFRPYDPARAIGDLSPTNPKPAKKAGGCGMIGQIIMMVVAVAVTAWIAPWATAFVGAHIAGLGAVGAAMVGGAMAGAAGSIASQAVGIGIGAQSGFNWKGVAMSAIGGAIGGGLGKVGGFLGKTGFASGVARGALGSALTQGIGVATGLQDKFSWAGVATAGLGGGLSSVVGKALGAQPLESGNLSPANIAANFAASTAAGLANAAARSLLTGTSFGDNILAVLPDVIGSTIGNALVGGVSGAERGLPNFFRNAEIMADPQRLAAVLQRKYHLGAADAAEQASALSAVFAGLNTNNMGRTDSGTPYTPQTPAQQRAYDAVIAQGQSAGSAADTARLVAIKEQADALWARLPRYRAIMPGMVRPLTGFRRAFNRMLIAADVYFDQSIPDLVPQGYRRLGNNELTHTALTARDLNNPSSGYFAALYTSDGLSFIYANRGTDSAVDWIANGKQERGYRTRQYDQAIENAISISAVWQGHVEFVGHSLGGGLAMAQALVTGQRATVFNPAALHPDTIGRYDANFDHSDLIRAYFVRGEALGLARWAAGSLLMNRIRADSVVLGATTAPVLNGNGDMIPGQPLGILRSLRNTTDLHSLLQMSYAMTSRYYSMFRRDR